MAIQHGLQYDPEEAIRLLSAADERMARLIEKAGPFTLEARSMWSPFQTLLRAIVYQQLSGKAAATIHGRVLQLLPEEPHLQPGHLLELPEESLRAAGMSRAKTAAARDLAQKTVEGIVPELDELHRMSDEDIIAHLVQVRGIGRWTVEMLLLFHLGRPDVLPIHDLGVRKGYKIAYGFEVMPAPSELLQYGERWRPFRSVASWYLWRAVDTLGPVDMVS